MVQPSSWVESGIKLSKVRDLNLFKFTDELQARLDSLAERKKSEELAEAEDAELAGILELDRIFTLLNARIIAEAWPLIKSSLALIWMMTTTVMVQLLRLVGSGWKVAGIRLLMTRNIRKDLVEGVIDWGVIALSPVSALEAILLE
jgi:hypothetical protein